jgi:transposase
MRKIKEVLRLKWGQGLSNRQIAKACGVARPTVGEYLRRADQAGLRWPLPAALSDTQLEQQLFPPPPNLPAESRGVPDWSEVHRELKHKGVTLFLLWQGYREANAEGYQYSWYCNHYRAWRGKIDVVMRQDHRAGEKLFVDYAGQTVAVIDRTTGEVRQAQIFVAVLGASNYTYAEATWTQGLPDWIGSHVRAFSYLGGVPELVVPDNLRAGVKRAHRYEPEINPTSGYGYLVWRRCTACTGSSSARQSQSGKRGISGRTLDAGGASPSAILFSIGAQRHPRRVAGETQLTSVQEAPRLSPGTLRADRPTGVRPPASGAVLLCRME